MAASRPFSGAELGELPERISQHFDRVRDLVEQEPNKSDA